MKNIILKRLYLATILLSFFFIAGATHNRAGEITYVQLSDLTYEVTVTTYTYTLSYADRLELEISWGDNSFSVARGELLFFRTTTKECLQDHSHLSRSGAYRIVVQDRTGMLM